MRTCLQLALGLALFACAAPRPTIATPVVAARPASASPSASTDDARRDFDSAIQAFLVHDHLQDWSESSCREMASRFDAIRWSGRAVPEATFNAGLALQRCGKEGEGAKRFEAALAQNARFHPARAELALYFYKAHGDLDAAIGALATAVRDAGFRNVAALVNLAALQMRRSRPNGSDGCADDLECAKQNLQRALAIDDAFMPAYNRLALLYLAQATRREGATDVQRLELAALVCSQAIRKNASYAPIHNTAGLVQHELGHVNGAVASFRVATALDPRLFEAQMNYAAANLSFRGFEEAQKAYQKALAIRPSDYDAHLGLALALRGRIDDTNHDKQVAAVRAELEAAKRMDAERPDAFYNEAILVEEYESKGGSRAQTIAGLSRAQALLASFIKKATGKPAYDVAVQRAKERIEDMEAMKAFIQGAGTSSAAPPPPRALPSPYGPAPSPQPTTPPTTPLPLPPP